MAEDKYDFFRRIGSPKLIVAPMVDHSDLAFRMLTRKYGAELVYTQMFNSNSFLNSVEYRECNFTTCPEDRPLVVQFCGHNPQTLLQAAKLVEDRCDAVDINLGCPQGIARRGHYGAFLMEELDLLTEIVSTLASNLRVPVTCKTRIYKDFDRSVRLCETLVNAGASLLTIHGRTREEKGHNVAAVDWSMIQRLKKHFEGRVPIIANGGIEEFGDIQECLEATGADGVMTSEAILENPAIFAAGGAGRTKLDLTEEYLHFAKQYPVWPFKSVRSHVMKFMHRYFVIHTDLRTAASMADSIEALEAICAQCRSVMTDDSDYSSSWYRRHRDSSGLLHAGSVGGSEQASSSLQRAMDQQRDRLWESVDADEGCVFDGLSLFGE